MKKNLKAYKTIGEVAEILELQSTRDRKNTHTIRYWENEFKQIKPTIINKRRHYDEKNIDLLKKIKFLLKDKGLTISGVKNLINLKINKLDGINDHSLKAEYYKGFIKSKSKILLDKVNKIKKHGKKNSS